MLTNISVGFTDHSASNASIELSTDWHFCPANEYQADINIENLQCYPIEIPGPWESVIPDYDGFGVLYRSFEIPQTLKQSHLAFYSQRIRDADKVFINDTQIGQTGEFPPEYTKAVFYSRLYSIPPDILNYDGKNQLKIWIYNDARPGGIMSVAPIITDYESLITKQFKLNIFVFGLIIVLLVFSLINLINYVFNLKSHENLYFGLFLISWCLYLFSSSDLVLMTPFSLEWMFRLNVIMFFCIFSLFLLFIYQFFKQTVPLPIKLSIATAILFIVISFLITKDKYVYYLVNTIELLSLLSLIYGSLLFYKVNKENMPYARIMTLILALYIAFGINEILLDYFYGNEAATYSPIGPWVLLLLSVVLTLIVGHKNMSYYKRATFDGLTGILRFENFPNRLERMINRAQKENKLIVVMMLDLDDFKGINDKYGHILGDKVLSTVGRTLRNEVTQNDLLARYGGDEFCIATIGGNEQLLRHFVNKIHTIINAIKIDSDGKIIEIVNTVGACILYPDYSSITPKQLIKQADDLLIEAKMNKKGYVLW